MAESEYFYKYMLNQGPKVNSHKSKYSRRMALVQEEKIYDLIAFKITIYFRESYHYFQTHKITIIQIFEIRSENNLK